MPYMFHFNHSWKTLQHGSWMSPVFFLIACTIYYDFIVYRGIALILCRRARSTGAGRVARVAPSVLVAASCRFDCQPCFFNPPRNSIIQNLVRTHTPLHSVAGFSRDIRTSLLFNLSTNATAMAEWNLSFFRLMLQRSSWRERRQTTSLGQKHFPGISRIIRKI